MDSINPLDLGGNSVQIVDNVKLIVLLIGTFFLGAMIAAIRTGIKEQDWLRFDKLIRTRQTNDQIKLLEDLASKAKDYE